jgi:Histidine kinase-, DNA gyrase B-, and HSP90-like ATPase
VDSALDRSQGGLGIGLSLARALVDLHGGGIEAISAGRGRGTEFVVTLPALPVGVVPNAPELATVAPPVVSVRRLLVVDDNRDGCDALATLLGIMGNEVFVAYDGVDAVEARRS